MQLMLQLRLENLVLVRWSLDIYCDHKQLKNKKH